MQLFKRIVFILFESENVENTNKFDWITQNATMIGTRMIDFSHDPEVNAFINMLQKAIDVNLHFCFIQVHHFRVTLLLGS